MGYNYSYHELNDCGKETAFESCKDIMDEEELKELSEKDRIEAIENEIDKAGILFNYYGEEI